MPIDRGIWLGSIVGMVLSGGEAMQTWERAAGAVARGPVGDLLRNLG